MVKGFQNSGIVVVETSDIVIKENHVIDAKEGVRITTGSTEIEVFDNVFKDVSQCEEIFVQQFGEGICIMNV